MVDNDLAGLLGIYAMRDIGRYMKTATRKMICPLSSRQVKYLKKCLFFYADHLDLYFSILLFLAIGYDKGCSDDKAAFLTAKGVLQSYLLCGRS